MALKPLRLRGAKGYPRKFGSTRGRGHGVQHEWYYRKLVPFDIRPLVQFITAQARKHKGSYRRFFVSCSFKVLGGLYQMKVAILDDPNEEPQWEVQWISTPVMTTLRQIPASLETFFNDHVKFLINNRPAWLLRVRLVFLKTIRPGRPPLPNV